MSKITLEKAREQIEQEMDQHGQFTHNIIGIVLRQVSTEFGIGQANELIDEYDITDAYGIHKVPENK